MLKKIITAKASAALAIFLISISFFTGWTSANALSKEANGDNSLKIVIVPSDKKEAIDNEKTDGLNTIQRPDLGDDQVFPFVAGLDSYEAMR